MISASDKFETIRNVMIDGKARTIGDICDNLGIKRCQSVKISRVLKTYVKYGFCETIGYQIEKGRPPAALWKWTE